MKLYSARSIKLIKSISRHYLADIQGCKTAMSKFKQSSISHFKRYQLLTWLIWRMPGSSVDSIKSAGIRSYCKRDLALWNGHCDYRHIYHVREDNPTARVSSAQTRLATVMRWDSFETVDLRCCDGSIARLQTYNIYTDLYVRPVPFTLIH